jgi:hypothetical protein
VTGGSSTLGVGFNSLNWTNPAFGEAALRLRDGLQYRNEDLYQASYDPGVRPSPGQLNVPPAWGAQINDPNGGRPARINQWNISIQRELFKNMIAEVSYLGNRGVWLEANNLVSHNATPLTKFQQLGLDLNNPADRTLLTSRIDSALAASRGFRAPYADTLAARPSRRRSGRSRSSTTASPSGGRRSATRGTTRCTSISRSGSGTGSISPRRSRGRRNRPWGAAATRAPAAGRSTTSSTARHRKGSPRTRSRSSS